MNASMLSRLKDLEQRLDEVNALLSTSEAASDMNQFRKLSREHSELTEVVEHFHVYQQAMADEQAAVQMRSDPELREFANDEIASAQAKLEVESANLERLLLPRDPDDGRNAFIEIRAGTGGDESALFAGDLLRMYTRFAESKGWQVEVVSASESELGGYREAVLRVTGAAPFGTLKFESGGHRVQRVPETETQGRIHTSACTVAVLAEPDEQSEIQISPDELRIDVYRASGAGGQHVNKTESAVRITHLPTGIVAECQDDRSQHRNKDKAMQVLSARIKDRRDREEQEAAAEHRRSLIGSGDRSERIRTYNFPQGRITDHRINLTLYKLDKVIAGEMEEVFDALRTADQAGATRRTRRRHSVRSGAMRDQSYDNLLLGSKISRADARVLMIHISGRSREWLIAHGDKPASAKECAEFEAIAEQRRRGMPVSYLTGVKEFFGRSFQVSPAVLVPRPETELLAAFVIANAPMASRVLDLGTGSGAIAVTIAAERSDLQVTATDQSAEALEIARINARKHQCRNIEFVQGDWFKPIDHDGELFSLIVSNPPYIKIDDEHLLGDGLPFEPQQALVSGDDGLDAIRQILGIAADFLLPDGSIIIEHGFDQGEAIHEIFATNRFRQIQAHDDLAGHWRASSGTKRGKF